MKNFSDIENNLVTSKDSLIESYTKETGLPKELVTKLYEDYTLQYGEDGVTDKFKSMLNVDNDISFSNVMKEFFDLLKKSTKDTINSMILKLLNQKANTNIMAFFKILSYLLFMKDKGNFIKLANSVNINEKLSDFLNEDDYTHLYESVGFKVNDDTKVPLIVGINDGCDIKQDIQFYTDLRTILARNNKRWGFNWHLDNVYEAIMNYLNNEIETLTTKDNIYTVDANFEDTLIKELIGGNLNPMYRDINILRPLIVDIQTLNFDLMCLVMSFVKTNSQYCRFLNRKTFDEFLIAFRELYSKISSSRKTSQVLVKYDGPETNYIKKEESEDMCCNPKINSRNIEILENVYIDTAKYDLYLQPLTIQAVVDILYIMKSCTTEFNLTIRPYINKFLTKSFEVIGKMEHIMMEAGKVNKYKSNFLY